GVPYRAELFQVLLCANRFQYCSGATTGLAVTLETRAVRADGLVKKNVDDIVDVGPIQLARRPVVFPETSGGIYEHRMQHASPRNTGIASVGVLRMVVSLIHRSQSGTAVCDHRGCCT